MKYCLFLLVSLLVSTSGFAQATASALLEASFEAHMANDFRKAGELAEQAFALPGAPFFMGAALFLVSLVLALRVTASQAPPNQAQGLHPGPVLA